MDSYGQHLKRSAFEGENWTLTIDEETILMRKMEVIGVSLGHYVNDVLKRGVLTGLNRHSLLTNLQEKD